VNPQQWGWVLRKAAAKANPVLAAALVALAARNEAERDRLSEWIPPARDPGEEG
jgi:hypothetical protein